MILFRPSFIFLAVTFTAILYWAYGGTLVDPFGFADLSHEQLRYGGGVFFGFYLASAFGYWLGSRFPNISTPSIKRYPFLESCGGLFLIVCSLLIYFEFVWAFFSAVIEGRGFLISDRSYIDRFSMLKIGLLIWSTFFIKKRYGVSFVPITLLGVFSVMLVFLDVSREAVIPAVAILFMVNGFAVRSFAIGLVFFVLIFSMLGRDYRISSISLELSVIYFVEAINYILGMCFLHFVQVVTTIDNNDFSLKSFFISIMPVPGALVGSSSLDSRNFDLYRPYGAAADLFMWSPGLMYILMGQWGFVLGCVRHLRKKILGYAFLLILCLIFVWIFQYHLRTSYKFLAWLTILVIFLKRDPSRKKTIGLNPLT